MDGPFLAKQFARNTTLIERHADGVSHEDSLRQSEHNINCFNWVVGHIIASRYQVLGTIDGAPDFDYSRFSRYLTGSDPIVTDGDDVLRFEELLEALSESQALLEKWLGSVDEAWLAERSTVGDHNPRRLTQIHFGYFHDTYHTGQVDLLRQVSGKSDKVI